MKKILFYTDTPNIGGAEKHMLILAKELKKLGVEISLAYGSYSQISKMHKDFEKVCKKIYKIKAKHKHDPRHYFELLKILNKDSFDLIHIHLWNPGAGRYAFAASKKKNLATITTEHDPFELSGIKKWIKINCLKATEKTIVISQKNKELLKDYYKLDQKKLSLIPNGIDLEPFVKDKGKAQLNLEGKVLMCIAELHKRKGHKNLINAFKKIKENHKDWNLVIVGKGPDEDKIKSYAKSIKDVHFLGWRNDIPNLIKASDLMILPSANEAFGQVIIEAMASEKVVIAVNNGGPKDIIQNEINGYLAKSNEVEELVKTIEIAIKNLKEDGVQKAAKKTALEKYSSEKMAKETLASYLELKK